MNKIILLLSVSLFSLTSVFAQDDMGEFIPGSEEIFFAYFGEVCSELIKEEERMPCSNDQINEYIFSLSTPDIVEKKKKIMAVVLYFDLNAAGKIINASVKKSSGNESLDIVVLEHFKKMPNWQPMTIDGVPFASDNMSITYRFKPTPKK